MAEPTFAIKGVQALPRVPGRILSLADEAANAKNMGLLIYLRWMAVVGQVVTIAVVQTGLGLELPLLPMAIVLTLQVLFNFGCMEWLNNRAIVSDRALALAVLVDVGALTIQLYLSGGATNPFISLFLLQVTLSAVLLSAWAARLVGAVTCAAFVLLIWFNEPIVVPLYSSYKLFNLHIAGMAVCFVLIAVLLIIFLTLIRQNLRERDDRLAALKQHAAEEDHIVRMGLLASGAAHELGTPLASLAVILGDWRRMPVITGDPDMAQELEEMQAAVQRCKSIVTGILMSSGEARGEAPEVTSVNAFVDEVVSEWRAAHPGNAVTYGSAFGEDLPIVADAILKQVVFNVLDNAHEVSPDKVHVSVDREDDCLVLRVVDAGPGFAPEILAHFGKPYQSSKGRRGGGLGLFLVVSVVRKLGGTVSARNQPEGGAEVMLSLPLHFLTIDLPGVEPAPGS